MSKPDLRISVISDVHVTHFGAGENEFRKALEFHTQKLPKSDMFLFTGDIAYQLDNWECPSCNNIYDSNYDFIMNEIETHIPEGTPYMMVLGNHEYPQGNIDPVLTKIALDTWLAKTGQPLAEHVILNGYHFIKYPVFSWAMESSPDYENWAMNEINIALAADPENPVFFVSHIPLHNTVADSGEKPSAFSEKFRCFLVNRPRVIHISGHRHTHILDEKAIYQEGFTSVSAPVCAVGYLGICGCGPSDADPIFGFSQSLYLEITGKVVTVYKIDLNLQKIVGQPWVIDISKAESGIFPYGKKRWQDAERPAFVPDAKLSVKTIDDRIFVSIEQKFLSFNVITEYYKLIIKDENGREVLRQTVCSDFYNLSIGENYAPEITYQLHGAMPGKYHLYVYPMNCFFASGDALHCAFEVD